MDIDGLLIFLSKRYGNGKFITDEHAIVLEGDYIFITANELVKIIAALKAAEARRKGNEILYPVMPSGYSEVNKLNADRCKAEAAYAALKQKEV